MEVRTVRATEMRAGAVESVDPWSVGADQFPGSGPIESQLRFLLRYAILAPSIHNCQPWVFSIGGSSISVFVDIGHWPKAVDPEQRDLYLSIGCAIENLVLAADQFGFDCRVSYRPAETNPMLVARVTFTPRHGDRPSSRGSLFSSIPRRRTNHGAFTGEPIYGADLNTLKSHVTDSATVIELTADPGVIGKIGLLLVQADAVMFTDRDCLAEIAYSAQQGTFGIPWMLLELSRLSSALLYVSGGTAKAPLFSDTSAFGVLGTVGDDRELQVRAGRSLERIYLEAANLGISIEPISFVSELPEKRSLLSDMLGMRGITPQVVLRLGYGVSETLPTRRRPLDSVILPSAAGTGHTGGYRRLQ